MAFVKRSQPQPSNPNQGRYEPANPYPEQAIIESGPPEPQGFKGKVQQIGTDFAKDQARDFAIGKVANIAAKTAIGARVFGVTKWFFIAEWGSLGLSVLFAVLGIIGIIQKDYVLGIFVMVLAAIVFGIFMVVRMVRQFVERQIERAYHKFMSLVQNRMARPEDWPAWYQTHKKTV